MLLALNLSKFIRPFVLASYIGLHLWTVGEAAARVPEWSFSLGTSQGYTVEALTRGQRVEIEVSKGFAVTSYFTKGVITDQEVSANFGALGALNASFMPSKKVLRQDPVGGCSGKPALVRFGRFEGVMRFTGEKDYVSFKRTVVRGARRDVAWDCSVRKQKEARDPQLRPGVSGIAGSSRRGKQFFVAFSTGGTNAITSFVVSNRETVGTVNIERKALAIADAEAYVVGPGGEVRIVPPAPFFGAASFRPGSYGEDRWMGTLGVKLPGALGLPLADGSVQAGPLGPKSVRRLVRILDSF